MRQQTVSIEDAARSLSQPARVMLRDAQSRDTVRRSHRTKRGVSELLDHGLIELDKRTDTYSYYRITERGLEAVVILPTQEEEHTHFFETGSTIWPADQWPYYASQEPPADRPDNQEQLMILRTAAGLMWPEFGEWAYDTWTAHNEAYFAGRLEIGGIVWGLTPHGKALGRHNGQYNVITLHESLLEPSDPDPWNMGAMLGLSCASDVLLHEMIHQAIYQEHGTSGRELSPGRNSSHNNDLWVAEVNRIAPLIGLPAIAQVVRQKRIDGKVKWYEEPSLMSRMEVSRWPYLSRPDGYYGQEEQPLLERLR